VRPILRTILSAAAIMMMVVLSLALSQNGSYASAVRPGASQVHQQQAIQKLIIRSSRPASYVIKRGDTLSEIAARFLGSSTKWPGLYEANRRTLGGNPNDIEPGRVIRLVIQGGYQPAQTTAYDVPQVSSGVYSFSGLESLWESAGGPAWAAPSMATIAECESGGNPRAYNPSGASGVFQVLGSVVPGNLFDPYINALNAVAKFRASGFSPWVCKP
jgi:hypothetical protein